MLMFLRDAEKFSASLQVSPTARADADEKEEPQFSEFVEIVDKYIKDGAPFEVNIESKTKIEVLRMTDRGIFNKQTRVSPRTQLLHSKSILLLPLVLASKESQIVISINFPFGMNVLLLIIPSCNNMHIENGRINVITASS